jgi:hypothetical protein
MRIMNPLIGLVLRSPVSRVIRPLAILRFNGRRTGVRRDVVVGWHILDGVPVVLTPALWRVNFAERRLATVRWRGHDTDYEGTLETDPKLVAGVVNRLLGSGTSPRALALGMPAGHTVTTADVVATRRAVIRFEPRQHRT